MVQGTTRQDTFTVDMDLTGAQAVYITYAQKRSGAYVEKSMSGISVSVNAGKARLSASFRRRIRCPSLKRSRLRFRSRSRRRTAGA